MPTVSAVGHEIDVTLADLAADVRALTPSEAAERVVPAAEEITARMRGYRDRLRSAVLRYTLTARSRLDALAAQRTLRKPWDIVHDRGRRLDELALRGVHRPVPWWNSDAGGWRHWPASSNRSARWQCSAAAIRLRKTARPAG